MTAPAIRTLVVASLLIAAPLCASAQDASPDDAAPGDDMAEQEFFPAPEPSIAPAMDFGFSDISSGLQICNDSGAGAVDLAILHRTDDTWISEGFWTLFEGECFVVLDQLQNRFVYYHAVAEGMEWSGPVEACISAGEIFEFRPLQCPDDAKMVGFREIDTAGAVAFTEYLQ